MLASTDHYIANLGPNKLALLEVDGDGTHHVIARRDGPGSNWVVSADGVPDAEATDIHDAILKMTEHMMLKTHGTLDHEGFSTWVPHGVRRLDGDEVFAHWHTSVGSPALN